MKKSSHLVLGFLIRLILLGYGQFQDNFSEVPYTDIDYRVYTDAALQIYNGKSPYETITYRYTPFLAILLVPNHIIHIAWGKLIFIICDLITFALFPRINKWTLFLWLYNPIIINMSTRGSSDSILCMLLLCIIKYNGILQGIFYGIAVHFRIYPMIFALPLFLRNPLNFKLFLSSAICFLLLTFSMYLVYGFEFLNHTYLYHLSRKDHRHNFSLYFYQIYLSIGTETTLISRILSFLPQFSLIFISGYVYYNDLVFCMFVQSFIFVIFNKVITAQYFIWFIVLLPMLLPNSSLINKNKTKGVFLIIIWVLSQVVWLHSGYKLEFLGVNEFKSLYFSSLLFYTVNVLCLLMFIDSYHVIKNIHYKKIK